MNIEFRTVSAGEFRQACREQFAGREARLRLMFAADERERDGCFRIYALFSDTGADRFTALVLALPPDAREFPSVTADVPAAHWYEREIGDMFGLRPDGHPDGRRLVFHPSFPANSHPLRKDWSVTTGELREWGAGVIEKVPHPFFTVAGDGIYEIPVGPVHAGIIEPGHFRFSAVGETIYFLEPQLFYTHKGTEKLFEKRGFAQGTLLAERVSGTSSLSHAAAYCMAVERMTGTTLSQRAAADRTMLIELERLYNHIGDIGNICAGTALQVGYHRGACIKERLQQLNSRLTGSRFLRGAVVPGGLSKDLRSSRDDILSALDTIVGEKKALMAMLLGSISHVERLENTGRLSPEIARLLGVTGVAARASGDTDDLRTAHPHLAYAGLNVAVQTRDGGDVLARMMVRSDEADESIRLIRLILDTPAEGALVVPVNTPEPFACGLGYAESPRGSVFYWTMADAAGKPLRVKIRSSSYCNWPAVPFAVHGNIVPDFPLCNKSFNLSYSGTDM